MGPRPGAGRAESASASSRSAEARSVAAVRRWKGTVFLRGGPGGRKRGALVARGIGPVVVVAPTAAPADVMVVEPRSRGLLLLLLLLKLLGVEVE